jgi:hypothetical protein
MPHYDVKKNGKGYPFLLSRSMTGELDSQPQLTSQLDFLENKLL